MFATLLGALPPPPSDTGGTINDAVVMAIRAQEAAGLEPITDGRLRDPLFEGVFAWLLARAREEAPASAAFASAGPALGSAGAEGLAPVDAWRFAAALTDRAVKQSLPGPYTLARRARLRARPARASGGASGGDTPRDVPSARTGDLAVRLAEVLRREVEALAAAGCPLIEIEESEAHAIGDDATERAAFAEAHRRLTDGFQAAHLSLSIVGGAAWPAGLETILAGSWSSLALDLIDGPDDWNIVTRLPRDLGVIVGALPAKASPADAKEVLVWAAHYAAASNGRGLDRVGLGSAGSYAGLTWEEAIAKLERLGEGARTAATPPGNDLARTLDPRAVDIRSAALGRVEPRPRQRRGGLRQRRGGPRPDG